MHLLERSARSAMEVIGFQEKWSDLLWDVPDQDIFPMHFNRDLLACFLFTNPSPKTFFLFCYLFVLLYLQLQPNKKLKFRCTGQSLPQRMPCPNTEGKQENQSYFSLLQMDWLALSHRKLTGFDKGKQQIMWIGPQHLKYLARVPRGTISEYSIRG